MAEKRMFAKTIIDSDAFLDMPMSTQALYFHLNMRADDDGFVNNPKKVQRMLGASEDDLKLLIAKKFIIAFENGIIVIKHWRINNYLRRDRYTETQYKEELAKLEFDENNAYRFNGSLLCTPLGTPLGIPTVDTDKIRLDKNRLDKNKDSGKNIPPPIEEVIEYCKSKGTGIDGEYFWNYYETRGWKLKNDKMKNWHSAVATWEKNEKEKAKPELDEKERAYQKAMEKIHGKQD
jgi:hypothetical protein